MRTTYSDGERVRELVFDLIYRNGPQDVGVVAERIGVTTQRLGKLVTHEWFVRLDGGLVDIAKRMGE